MTRNEAFEFLGLETGASPDQVRRAYLRKLPKHKPERDPEGFRRLREAYEIASTPTFFVLAPAEPAEEAPLPFPPPAPPPQTPPPSTAPGWETVVPPPTPPATEPPVEPPAERRVVPRPEMAKADDPVELAEESERLSAHGDPRKVVAAAVRALEARRRVGGWSPTAPLLRASLHLTARGHHDAGARILYELRKLPPGELQDGFTSEDELLTWLVTRELASLSPDFPDDLRREIASATVEPRPGCPEDLITFMVQDRPEEAVDALREIEEKASTLYQMYGDVLWVPELARQPELARKPAPERDRDPSLRHALSRLGLWVLILAVIALAREGCSTEPPPPVPEAPPPRVEEAPTDPAPTDLAAAVARDATHDLDAFCAFAPDSAWDCTLGYAIVEAYSEARCLEARGAMVELSRLIEFDRAGYVPPSTLEILRSLGSHTDCGDPGADRYGRPPT